MFSSDKERNFLQDTFNLANKKNHNRAYEAISKDVATPFSIWEQKSTLQKTLSGKTHSDDEKIHLSGQRFSMFTRTQFF
jgi:hypothetical protein